MKQGLKRILCVSAILLAGLVALFVWRPWIPSEPVYQGKRLTDWIKEWNLYQMRSEIQFYQEPNGEQKAETAIRSIGTNGIPYLLRLIRRQESAATSWLKRALPSSWHERLGMEDDDGSINSLGSRGLYILGTNGGSAVPALIELLSTELNRSRVDEKQIYLLTFPLRSMKGGADPAIPLLIECLTNANRLVRREAARTLSQFSHKPEIVVPALVKFLSLQNQPDRLDEEETIKSIGMFGTNAASSTPALTGYLTDPDPTVREAATNSLRRVDPSAAEHAGVRINQSR